MATLSEFDSKKLLSDYGLAITKETIVKNSIDGILAVETLGYPVVAKLCGQEIQHKTDVDGIRLNLRNSKDLEKAIDELLEKIGEGQEILIAQQVNGKREFIAGYHIDPDFGPVLMFGVGGIFTEAISDVNFRLLPSSRETIRDLIFEIKSQSLLGEFRGEDAVAIDDLIDALEAIAKCGIDNSKISSIDVNPIIISKGKPIAVDALVITS